MKFLSLIVWVTQLGFSVLFPLCFFLFLAHWLMTQFGLGYWIMVLLGVLGLLTSFSTAKSCVKSILKEMGRIEPKDEPPMAFNDHT